jgi:RNA polymerase sigma-32 factor
MKKTKKKPHLKKKSKALVPALSQKSLIPLSAIQIYLREVAKYPLLDPEEELRLAIDHYEGGDAIAAHRLITANLRLVVKIANEFSKAQTNFLDLIQEGNYGLAVAVKKFNPYKGSKLSSYAAWWIKAYILKYLLENKGQLKIATTAAQRKLFYNLEKETSRLLSEGDPADAVTIAENLKVREKDVIEMQKRMTSPEVSLDSPIQSDGEKGFLLRDSISDKNQQDIAEVLADEQVKKIFLEHLQEFKTILSEREQNILQERLMSESPLTLQEIGKRYGISRERARQIEVQIIKKLKKFIHQKGVLDIN